MKNKAFDLNQQAAHLTNEDQSWQYKDNILYIHGFNSSPLSTKALQTKAFLAEFYPNIDFYCPQLATNSRDAISQLEALLDDKHHVKPRVKSIAEGEVNTDTRIKNRWFLLGSSLGGYFADYLAQQYDLPAVLINPAVKPYQLLTEYLGEQTQPYTKEVYFIGASELKDLKALEQKTFLKNKPLVMLQTGDEVLNYQLAATKYQHCQLVIQQGGDHSFVGFGDMLPDIAKFFQLAL